MWERCSGSSSKRFWPLYVALPAVTSYSGCPTSTCTAVGNGRSITWQQQGTQGTEHSAQKLAAEQL